MKRSLLILSTFLSAMSFAQNCSDLFISEYVEGRYNNKALEIYNPTANSINLSDYIVIRFSNGSTSVTAVNAVQLTGTIAPYSTHVGVLDKRNPAGTGNELPVWDELKAIGEMTGNAFYCPDYNISEAWYWNGNDAVVLAKGSASNPAAAVLVDVFGKIGENPGSGSNPQDGWTAESPFVSPGTSLTVDHSLIRKATILKGVTNPNITFFNALAEYDSIPAEIDVAGNIEGNWASLGSHDCNCAPASIDEVTKANISIFPNPSNGTFTIKGIEGISSIQVLNSLGQTVQTIDANTNSIVKIDLLNRKGVYFVKLTDDSGDLITKKVIIK